jgi:hypothetical protein
MSIGDGAEAVVCREISGHLAQCEWCRAPFERHTGGDRAGHRFCSSRCRYSARDRRNGHLAEGTMVSATCARCGGRFFFRLLRRPRKFCDRCR